MTGHNRKQVDVNEPRFNQGAVALLTAVAFLTGWWLLVAVAWIGIALNRIAGPRWGPFTQAYRGIVKPRLRAEPETEWAAPPRFSQVLAILFLGLAMALFAAGFSFAGWAVTVLVTALATLAATARICVGCIVYEWVAAT